MKHSLINRSIILAVIIFSIISTMIIAQIRLARNVLENNTLSSLQNMHYQVQKNINSYLYDLERILLSLSYNTSIQQYIKAQSETERILKYDEVQSVFSDITLIHNNIHGISLFDEQMDLLISYGVSFNPLVEHDPYSLSRLPTYVALYPETGDARASYCSLLYPVYDMKYDRFIGGHIGTVLLIISTQFFQQQIISGNSYYDDSIMFLIDDNGMIISTSHQRAFELLKIVNDDINDNDIIIKTSLSKNNWQLLTIMPRGIIAKDMAVITQTTLIINIVILFILIAIFYLLYRNVFHPIREVNKFMEIVSENAINEKAGSADKLRFNKIKINEFYMMANTMNQMLDSLERQKESIILKEKQYFTAVLERNRMELLAYRNQINPHFLYNTLDCIRGIALYRNAPEITEISQSLSHMFHYVVKGENYVTIAEEITHINEYAKIIGYRFQNRIKIFCQVDDLAAKIKILKLIIQPVVENSVFHGLESKPGNGLIDVCVTEGGGEVIISVMDNGVGMAYDELASLRGDIGQIMDSDDNIPSLETGIGLTNIVRRLKLFYGGDGLLSIDSGPENGTKVEIRLPMRREGTFDDEI